MEIILNKYVVSVHDAKGKFIYQTGKTAFTEEEAIQNARNSYEDMKRWSAEAELVYPLKFKSEIWQKSSS